MTNEQLKNAAEIQDAIKRLESLMEAIKHSGYLCVTAGGTITHARLDSLSGRCGMDTRLAQAARALILWDLDAQLEALRKGFEAL